MKVDKAIKHYESQVKLARALGCSESSVSQWKARGGVIPIKVALRLVEMTKGKLKLNEGDYR